MTTFMVVIALVFAQLAVAAYVCGQDALAAAQMAAMGEPCEGVDTDQPNLCQQVASDPSQSFEQVKVAAPTLPAVLTVVVHPDLVSLDQRVAPGVVAPALRPPRDPLFLSTLRLRV